MNRFLSRKIPDNSFPNLLLFSSFVFIPIAPRPLFGTEMFEAKILGVVEGIRLFFDDFFFLYLRFMRRTSDKTRHEWGVISADRRIFRNRFILSHA